MEEIFEPGDVLEYTNDRGKYYRIRFIKYDNTSIVGTVIESNYIETDDPAHSRIGHTGYTYNKSAFKLFKKGINTESVLLLLDNLEKKYERKICTNNQ